MKRFIVLCLVSVIISTMLSCARQNSDEGADNAPLSNRVKNGLSDTADSNAADDGINIFEATNDQNISAPSYVRNLKYAPQLEVYITEDGMAEQRVIAAQLTTSWSYKNDDGTYSGYETDSLHPLDLPDDYDYTLIAQGEIAYVMFEFGDDFPPLSVSVIRWNANYAAFSTGSRDFSDEFEHREIVGTDGNSIQVGNDGLSYIYMVHAIWDQGNSYYSFRVIIVAD